MPKGQTDGLGNGVVCPQKDGEVFPVEISLGHYEMHGGKLAVAFVTNITDRVKAKKIVGEREA